MGCFFGGVHDRSPELLCPFHIGLPLPSTSRELKTDPDNGLDGARLPSQPLAGRQAGRQQGRLPGLLHAKSQAHSRCCFGTSWNASGSIPNNAFPDSLPISPVQARLACGLLPAPVLGSRVAREGCAQGRLFKGRARAGSAARLRDGGRRPGAPLRPSLRSRGLVRGHASRPAASKGSFTHRTPPVTGFRRSGAR